MKKIILTLTLLFAQNGFSISVDKVCSMANEMYCSVDLSQNELSVLLHGSSGDLCGIKLVSNHNFIFPILPHFIKGLKAQLENRKLQIVKTGNSISIFDKEPLWLFIANILVETQTKEPFAKILSQSISQTTGNQKDLNFVIVPLKCQDLP